MRILQKTPQAGWYGRFGVWLILFLVLAAGALFCPSFLSIRNFSNILCQNAVILLLGIGAQTVLIAGEIDLSSGAIAAFSGVMAALCMTWSESLVLSAALGLLCGMAFGLLNGWIVTAFEIPAFIATLAAQFMVRGAILAITHSQPVSGLPERFFWLGQGRFGSIPAPVGLTAIALLLYWILMNRLKYGRFFYAVGGNPEAARATGIRVKQTRVLAFAFAGLMSGLGGVVLMSRLNSGQPTGAENYEFNAITAAVIGGTSMSGGYGSVHGLVFGAIIMGMLLNILTLLDVGMPYQQMARGLIITLAVILDVRARKREEAQEG